MPGYHFLCLLARPGGKLVTYGPYAQDGVLAPESNQQVENLSFKKKDTEEIIKKIFLFCEFSSSSLI